MLQFYFLFFNGSVTCALMVSLTDVVTSYRQFVGSSYYELVMKCLSSPHMCVCMCV